MGSRGGLSQSSLTLEDESVAISAVSEGTSASRLGMLSVSGLSCDRSQHSHLTIDKLQFDQVGVVGRDNEEEMLKATMQHALDSSGKAIILISGPAGVGKSTLAKQARKFARQSLSIFASGKFKHDFYQPYVAFVEACSDLSDFFMRPSTKYGFTPSQVIKEVHSKLDREVRDLLHAIFPKLRRLLVVPKKRTKEDRGDIPTHIVNFNELQTALQNAVFQLFKVLSKFGCITLLMDDVHWADEASVDLIKFLLQQPELQSFVLIATYRGDEMGSDHPFMGAIESWRIRKDPTLCLAEMTLGSLDVASIIELLGSMISSTDNDIAPLAKLVHSKTGGNAFFVKEYLTVLTNMELVRFSLGSLKWSWDLDVIKRQTLATTNVVDMIVERLQSLPPKLCELLPCVACLGSVFTQTALNTVAYHYCQDLRALIDEYVDSVKQSEGVDEEDSFDDDLSDILCREGLLCREQGGIYRWQHDKILEALLQLVDPDQMEQIKFEVGRLLLRELSKQDLALHLFSVVNLLNARDVGPTGNPWEIVRLNVRAGRTALSSSSASLAIKFLEKGKLLLPKDSWAREQSLSVELHSCLAEAYFCIGRHDQVHGIFESVYPRDDVALAAKRRICTAKLYSLAAQGLTVDAKNLTLEILEQLGCRFPKRNRTMHAIAGIVST